jgi:hypothetical protein
MAKSQEVLTVVKQCGTNKALFDVPGRVLE